MCNRFVQFGKVIKPGEPAMVLMNGPGGDYEAPVESIFGGPARKESRIYWLNSLRASEVVIPGVSRFGEQHEITHQQTWEELPPGSALRGFLLPAPPGKSYRLLKVITQPATPDQIDRLGNDRAPVVQSFHCPPALEREIRTAFPQPPDSLPASPVQGELF